MLEEVVVTAQRREERLQDVPAAISSLSGEDLNRRNLLGNADLAARVPGLSLEVQGPGESTLSIRGVGTAYGLAPAVSYYLNETPLDIRTDGSTGVPDIDFFDVDRVEVLRGPQGTLIRIELHGRRVARPDGPAGPDRILRQGRDGCLDDGRRRDGLPRQGCRQCPARRQRRDPVRRRLRAHPRLRRSRRAWRLVRAEPGPAGQRTGNQRRRRAERAHPRPHRDRRQR